MLVRSRDKDGKQIWLDVSVQQLSCTRIEDPISVLDLSHLKMDDTFSRNLSGNEVPNLSARAAADLQAPRKKQHNGEMCF